MTLVGYKNSSADTSVKIVNGDNANIEDHPWMVAIQFLEPRDTNFTFNCGGAIIDRSWVLTAAHCNSFNTDRPAKNIRILAGSSFMSKMKVKIPVKKYYVHDQFKYVLGYGWINDLMLLQLRKPLKFGPTINKIDMDTDIGKNYTGELCTITGWGDTDVNLGKIFPDRLQVQTMPVVSDDYCRTVWNNPKKVMNNLICLQKNNTDSCLNDSGGPLVCKKKLVGTLTYGGDPCNGKKPSVHTRTSTNLNWIKGKMNTKNKKNKKNKKDKKNKNNQKGKGKKNKKNNRN
ncbi:Hypothetical predicted protein [Mytilus galloprovincialis]|uniref:Peptidase S1 domain-containing protein n=2 Tax=Mytilus galloprovincialis TaxID=29158 RepID=A0A8B6GJR1_MYTGA|nr:Hypothetical predicted protein [Mytilus galloprovincialis]